ncbi:MAG: rhamnogalacturonan acetylesterase [Verrucomicrobia bacterium]|nr:MAG: rhamnogalacturonan acetylesterase [Verrucomicrobiota bacterium]TAE88940.1 MAG: rhamnogalacturonan acetylesterase [Verrucomicrobiota bacterium]TAF27356.1 MAG: rhamnogalacturonan acetylesterase [Verrucomicrobiota bacterium]TAF42353.1 MAG: rhamnogalacturonan acetylesterase [Verrucomicrobiota bacterium]
MTRSRTLFTLLAITLSANATSIWKFDFGSNPPASGFTAVRAADRFTPAHGHGFDLDRPVTENATHVTGSGGFYFSLGVPEGCYEILATLGDDTDSSDTTIKAESRRLMIDHFTTLPGQAREARFTVHIRRPSIPGAGAVRLKARENHYLHWDDKLTLEFNGPAPRIDRLEIRRVEKTTVVHLLGDSTVADQAYEPWNSWGQMLPRFFTHHIAVANHAESGESIRSSLSARRVDKLYHSLAPGDHVLIQFGHNDMKDRSPDALSTYRRNLSSIVHEIRKRGGNPTLVTSMERKHGLHKDSLGAYPDTVRSIARELKVPLIDLHKSSRTLYQALGPRLDLAFQDGTHHNNYGSYQLARCIVEGIRDLHPDLARHLRPETGRFDPEQPDDPLRFEIPASPLRDPAKPDGD